MMTRNRRGPKVREEEIPPSELSSRPFQDLWNISNKIPGNNVKSTRNVTNKLPLDIYRVVTLRNSIRVFISSFFFVVSIEDTWLR